MLGLVILDTDYDNYTVEYICMSYYKMIRLMTRTPGAPNDSFYNLLKTLLSSSELKSYSIHSYPQLNCT